MEFKNR